MRVHIRQMTTLGPDSQEPWKEGELPSPSPSNPQNKETGRPVARSRKLRILLLEDNPMDAELTKQSLLDSTVPCDITLVRNGGEYIAALESAEFEAIISDYSLPAFDGLSALSIARKHHPHTPFIFCTGSLGEEKATELLKSGATDYVLKDRLARLPSAVGRAVKEAADQKQRRRAEESLAESEALFRAVAESLGEGLIITDLQDCVVYVNSRTLELLGLLMAEVLGRPVSRVLTPGDGQAPAKETAPWNAHDTIRLHELEFRRHVGAPVWLQIQAAAMRDASGVNIGTVMALTDITERKLAEQRIREHAELLDKATDAIWLTDLQQRFAYWSKGAERLYGWAAADILGRKAAQLIFKADSPYATDAMKCALDKGEWTGELNQMTKDGKEAVFETRLTLVKDGEGKPKAILAINTDITARKQLESQFLRAQRMESIGTLAAGIAHDLNNNLAPILMAVELLRMKGLRQGGETDHLLSSIESGARRGADMVKQILSFARGVQGERMVLQVRHLISEMADVAKETFPQSVSIRTKTVKDLWPILGDATQMHQVLLNLCVNARDAMPNGGNLQIEAENQVLDELYARQHHGAKAGPYVIITVTDTGTGIPPQVMEHIFDPFFTTKEPGKGTGLGLSTLMGIVRSHGGFVTVYSEINRGTRFKIYLPAAACPASESDEENVPILAQGHGEIILVVDDEPDIRAVAKQTLEANGYRVVSASDGIEAVAAYANPPAPIDLVLTDMSMPHMDGPATIRVLLKMNPKAKIVAMSGMTDAHRLNDLTDSAPIPSVEKPFSAAKLLAVVNGALHPSPEPPK